MAQSIDALVDKIRKLRAKSEGTDNEHEAAIFAAKVAEMLAENGLSMADITEDLRDDPIGDMMWETMYLDPWRRHLIQMAAKLYFCSTYLFPWRDGVKKRDGIRIVGRPHNAIVAKEMSEYLINTTVRLARNYSGERSERLGFERGCGERLARRLYEKWQEQTAAAAQHSPSGNPANLPALYQNEDRLVREFKARLGLVKATGLRGSELGSHHSAAGARAANSVSLSGQISSSRSGGHLLK